MANQSDLSPADRGDRHAQPEIWSHLRPNTAGPICRQCGDRMGAAIDPLGPRTARPRRASSPTGADADELALELQQNRWECEIDHTRSMKLKLIVVVEWFDSCGERTDDEAV